MDPDPATRNNMKLDDEVIDIESIEIPGTPGKKVKGKYKDLFIQKQLQLLANVKQKDSLAAAVDKPAAIRKLSNQSVKVKRLKNIQSDRQSRKARFDKRRALLGKVGKRPKTTKTKVSRSTCDDNPSKGETSLFDRGRQARGTFAEDVSAGYTVRSQGQTCSSAISGIDLLKNKSELGVCNNFQPCSLCQLCWKGNPILLIKEHDSSTPTYT